MNESQPLAQETPCFVILVNSLDAMSGHIGGAWGPYIQVEASDTQSSTASQQPQSVPPGNQAALHPSPSAASHNSPSVDGGPLSPSSTLDPSDSVSRTHSPPPRSIVGLEEEIPRQNTDEENMDALGDILSRAAKHQKQLRMSRLRGRTAFGAAPSAPAKPAESPPKSNGSSTPMGSQHATPPASISHSHPQLSPSVPVLPISQNVIDSHMMPPDPFAAEMINVPPPPTLPMDHASPPAAPFLPSSSGNVAIFGNVAEQAPAPVPWTKELVVIGIYAASGSFSPSGKQMSIPVAIAASPDQDV